MLAELRFVPPRRLRGAQGAVIERMSHNVAVMRGGKIVEAGTRRAVFETPREDYTKALIAAVPMPDPTVYRTAKVVG